LKKHLMRPEVFALAIALLVFGGLSVARLMGWLQKWELAAYDAMVRVRARPPASDSGITIIGIDEADIRQRDYPLRDGDLAEVLQKILAAKPRAIGLDIYRDLPEPRSGAELPKLVAVLKGAENIVTIFSPSEPGKPGTGVPGPIALKSLTDEERPDRIAINDFPTDPQSDGAIARRALILGETASDGGGLPSFSFPFRLAMIDVEAEATAHHQPPPSLEFVPEDVPEIVRLGKAEFHRFHQNDGGYRGVEENGIQFLIDYRAKPNYPQYSVADLRAGRVPAQALHDRVVMIGGVAPFSIKDTVPTPLDSACRGVVAHAQVEEQIRRAAIEGIQPTQALRGWMHPLNTLLWALLGGASALMARRWPKSAPFALAVGLSILAAIHYGAFERGWWLPPVEPSLAYIVSAVTTQALVFALERWERGRLMKLFSRYVSPGVAKSIWEQRDAFIDGNRPRAQKVTATVLFTDFVGFSSLSEKMNAASLMLWLNDGMEHLARHVEPHGGMVDKFIGDAIMAIFGVPVPSTTQAEISRDASNAVRCALRMSAELESMNALWFSMGRPRIGMRIGIHTGDLIAGSIGSRDRQEYTVIGDTVNTASRLEGARKDEIPPPPGRRCRILIGEATYRLLDGRFTVEPVGAISLKGKENMVNAYSVLGEIDLNDKANPSPAAAL
jgi:adenylate cyclase